MYQSLYRKWRPRTFDELCGQDHITTILRRQCEENRVSHAYLFCGTRGTGKTSTAKILAKAVNCEHPVNGNPCCECASCLSIDSGAATDVLEIDAASNNSVGDIRGLRDEVIYPPSVLKKRVYIIDEVHMLSSGAFNALLKTLEEPPEYIVFILATTELNKLPPTIVSRCVRFDFQRLSEQVITDRLLFVSAQESIGLDEDAAGLIARLADGAMRDGLSILEACNTGLGAGGRITASDVEQRVGLAGADQLYAMMKALFERNTPGALEIVDDVHRSSKDLSVFLDDLSAMTRDLLVMTEMKKAKVRSGGKFRYQKEELRLLNEFEPILTSGYLTWMCGVLEEATGRLSRYASDAKIRTDLMVIRLCDPQLSDNASALLARISALEAAVNALKSGTARLSPASLKADEPRPSPAQEANRNETATAVETVEPSKEDQTNAEPETASSVPEGPAPVSNEEKPAEEDPEPAQPVSQEQPEAEPASGNAGFLPFDRKPELLELMEKHPDSLPFLQKGDMLCDPGNGVFLIRTERFGVTFLQYGRNPGFIREALKALTGIDWELRFEPLEEPKQTSLFDELE